MLQSSDSPLFEWYDMLGAPTWEVCVLMDTPIGCVDEDCITPADLESDCELEIEGEMTAFGSYVIEAFGQPEDALVNWVIDGNWLNFGGPVLELTPDMLEGAQEVCAFYETLSAPPGCGRARSWNRKEGSASTRTCSTQTCRAPRMGSSVWL